MLSSLDRWFAPAPDPARVAWLKGITYAHRGLHGAGAGENSPTAFAAAIEAGLGIECDVQQTADGAAVVFHDWELERLTAETGPVLARTASALSRLRLQGSDDTIWPLPRLLAEVAGRVPLLIELKSRRQVPFAPLCRAVLDAPAPVSEAAVTLGDVGATIAATATPPIAASAFSPTPGADVPTPFPRPVN